MRIQRVTQTFQELLQTSPHHMDVLNPNKLEADVRVVVLVLIAFPCCTVRQRVQLSIKSKCGLENMNVNRETS